MLRGLDENLAFRRGGYNSVCIGREAFVVTVGGGVRENSV